MPQNPKPKTLNLTSATEMHQACIRICPDMVNLHSPWAGDMKCDPTPPPVSETNVPLAGPVPQRTRPSWSFQVQVSPRPGVAHLHAIAFIESQAKWPGFPPCSCSALACTVCCDS